MDVGNIVPEVIKSVPVKEIYADLVHPPLSELGNALAGTVKLAFIPISGFVWCYDKIAGYLDRAIPEYFAKRNISKDKIITPDPAIAVPLIEAMRYTSHKEEIRNIFVNLLGASMNRDTSENLHPSFVEIVKQLTPDEAKILRELHKTKFKSPIIKLRKEDSNGSGYDFTDWISNIPEKAKCENTSNFSKYYNNLERLGLLKIHEGKIFVDDTIYDTLVYRVDIKKLWSMETNDNRKIKIEKSYMKLTAFGKNFCEICGLNE